MKPHPKVDRALRAARRYADGGATLGPSRLEPGEVSVESQKPDSFYDIIARYAQALRGIGRDAQPGERGNILPIRATETGVAPAVPGIIAQPAEDWKDMVDSGYRPTGEAVSPDRDRMAERSFNVAGVAPVAGLAAAAVKTPVLSKVAGATQELPGFGVLDGAGRLKVPKQLSEDASGPYKYEPLDAQAYRSRVDQAEAAWKAGAKDDVAVPFPVDQDSLPQSIMSRAWDAAEEGQLSTSNVNLSDLVAVQSGVDASRVAKIIRNEPNPTWERLGGDDRPMVVRYNGKLYLVDGHHRLSAAYAQGRQNADVDMYLASNPSTASVLSLMNQREDR